MPSAATRCWYPPSVQLSANARCEMKPFAFSLRTVGAKAGEKPRPSCSLPRRVSLDCWTQVSISSGNHGGTSVCSASACSNLNIPTKQGAYASCCPSPKGASSWSYPQTDNRSVFAQAIKRRAARYAISLEWDRIRLATPRLMNHTSVKSPSGE
jgi:hypothetical protein